MTHEHFDCYYRIDKKVGLGSGRRRDDYWVMCGRYPKVCLCREKIEELERMDGGEYRIIYVKEYSLDWRGVL
jgi:hypothetical protein